MATYVIRVPDDGDDAYQLNQLLNALEHFHGIITHNAVVVVTEGDELAEVLGPRAEHVITYPEAQEEDDEGCDCSCLVGRLPVAESLPVPGEVVELPFQPENMVKWDGGALQDLTLANGETLSRTFEVTIKDGPRCEHCGTPIDKKEYNSKRFCSARCYMRAYQKKYKSKKNEALKESEVGDENA